VFASLKGNKNEKRGPHLEAGEKNEDPVFWPPEENKKGHGGVKAIKGIVTTA